MKYRWNRPLSHAPVFVVLALCLAFTPAARATEADPSEATEDGWKKVLAYARCAFATFKAVTPSDWATAFFDCGRTFLEETTGDKP